MRPPRGDVGTGQGYQIPAKPKPVLRSPRAKLPSAFRVPFVRGAGGVRAVTPIEQQQRNQRSKTRRAARKLPREHDLPRVPLLTSYTPQQRQAVIGGQKRALARNRQRTGRTNREIYRQSDTGTRKQLQLGAKLEAQAYAERPNTSELQPSIYNAKIAGIPIFPAVKKIQQILVPAPTRAIAETLRATAEDPAAVAKSSVRTGVESIAGIPQGVKAIAHDPRKALHAIAKDYEDRYGPILAGNGKLFRERLKKDYGLTPYLLDAGGFSSLTGRALGVTARSGAFDRAVTALRQGAERSPRGLGGGRAARGTVKALEQVQQTATRERPLLRQFAGETGAKAQRTSKNLYVAAGQRVLDRTRGKAWQKRLERAGLQELPTGQLRRTGRAAPQRLPALRPGPGEVLPVHSLRELPLLRRYTGRTARDLGGRQSVQRIRMLEHRGRTLSEVNKVMDRLKPEEKSALKYMVQLGVGPDANGIRALQRRLAQMSRARKQEGRSVAPILADSNDEVALIRRILKDPEKHLTPELRQAADELRTIQLREAARDPDLPAERELIRRVTPQAQLLGVPKRLQSAADEVAVALHGAARQDAIMLRRRAASADRVAAKAQGGVPFVPLTRRTVSVNQPGPRAPFSIRVDRQLSAQARASIEERLSALPTEIRASAVKAHEHVAQIEKVVNSTGRRAKVAEARTARPTVDDAERFAERTRKAAEDAGLHEPAYWMSSPRPEDLPSLAAVGRGLRAAHRDRAYKGDLYRVGAEEHTPDVFVRGLERNIKRRFSWSLVAGNLDRHVFEWSRGKHGEGMNVTEIKRELDRRMIDPATVQIVDTRIARHRDPQAQGVHRGEVADFEDLQIENSADLSKLIQDAPQDLTPNEIQLHAQNRYLVVPRAVGEAVDGAAVKLDNQLTRALEVVLKQKPARILLGAANVPWLAFQVASNALLTGLGGGFNPLDIYGAHKWWRGLDQEAKDAVEAELGITHGHHFAMDQPNLGKTNNHFVAFWRGYKASKVGRHAHKANPLDLMFRADEAQNNFFRKVLFHNQARKAAYKRMGRSWRGIDTGLTRLTDRVLARPPERQATAIAMHGPEFEQVAQHVRDFLGDYLRFSPSERLLLSRNVMFYGYLRFSLRFAFYTMPVQHPVMTAILSDVGRMGAQEIKDLFGVPNDYRLPTSMLANAYFGDRHDAKAGRLQQIPFGRFNPFLNAVTQLESEQQLAGLVSPIYQALADQAFEESSFTGKDWAIKGEPTPAQATRPKDYYGSIFGLAIPGRPRNRILLRQLLQLAYPYRAAEKTGIPGTSVKPLEGPQGDDSLLFSPRPTQYRDPATVKSIEKSNRQQQARGTTGPLLDHLVPLLRPQTTRAPDVVAREREKEAAAAETARRAKLSPSARKALEKRNRSRAAKKAARTRRHRSGGSSGGQYGGGSSSNPYGGGGSSYKSRYGG